MASNENSVGTDLLHCKNFSLCHAHWQSADASHSHYCMFAWLHNHRLMISSWWSESHWWFNMRSLESMLQMRWIILYLGNNHSAISALLPASYVRIFRALSSGELPMANGRFCVAFRLAHWSCMQMSRIVLFPTWLATTFGQVFVAPVKKSVQFVKQAGKELRKQAQLTQVEANADGWLWPQSDCEPVEHTLKLWERCTADLGRCLVDDRSTLFIDPLNCAQHPDFCTSCKHKMTVQFPTTT